MRWSWSTIFKILLCIALCAISIFILYWKTKKVEGFQTITASTYVVFGAGTYMGITTPMTTVSNGTTTVKSSMESNPTTKSIMIGLQSQITNFKFNTPVEIWAGTRDANGIVTATGTAPLDTGFLFAYNYPILIVHSNNTLVGNSWKATPTGFTWSTGSEIPRSSYYVIQARYCSIPSNQSSKICDQPSTESFPPETIVESEIYDTYELYNFDSIPAPNTTNVEQYDMAQELTSYDTGAPIAWDYDNRTFDPKNILWGNIHPSVSQSIFTTGYNRDILKSINNLNWEGDSGWSYRSPMFETTWEGDDEKFLPGIQIAEFLTQTVVGMAVEKAYNKGESAILKNTTWGRNTTAIYNASTAAAKIQTKLYSLMRDSNISHREALNSSQRYRDVYFEEAKKMNRLSKADIKACTDEYDRLIGGPKGSPERIANEKSFAKLTAAVEGQFQKANSINNALSVGQTTSAASTNSAVNADKVATSGAVKERTVMDRAFRGTRIESAMSVKSIESRSINASSLVMIGRAARQRLANGVAGKVALKLAKAIGAAVEGNTMLWGIATLLCGGQMQVCGPVVIAINVFIDLFVISCVSWIPAILQTYIASDAVCPENSFNIYDSLVKLPGGEMGWQIISAVPGIGDALGTFGPFLCSEIVKDGLGNNQLGRVFLKQNRITPGYFFDSTITIYCDRDKAAMSPDEPQFSDRRMYTRNALVGKETTAPPYWKNSLIPPIWVDFSDYRLLDRMAQFYYRCSRRLAIDNGDGTCSFEYITKFYGVVVSSEYSCDVQCEITNITYYRSTGDIKSKYVVPIDTSYDTGTTYHDRRFYFYAVQVSDDPKLSANARKSASNVEEYYSKLFNYSYVTFAARKEYVASRDDETLEALMTDNVMRYIVTACTNTDGTAPNAMEVNEEGQYVGDSVISLGGDGRNRSAVQEYYPPEISINTGYLALLSNAITNPIASTSIKIGSVSFTYINPYIVFAPTQGGTAGDTVHGYLITTPSTSTASLADNLEILMKETINTTNFFSGTVTAYSQENSSEQTVIINITSITLTLPTGNLRFAIRVHNRSSLTLPGMNDGGCSAMRSSVYRTGSAPVDTTPTNNDPPTQSYAVTVPSITSVPWQPGVKISNGSNKYKNTQKMWVEKLQGQVLSQAEIDKSISQNTFMGYIGYRVSWRGYPVGAAFTSGVLSTNFKPEWSIAALWACSYKEMTKDTGKFILNGEITDIQIGQWNQYLYVNNGPIIPFAPGYIPVIFDDVVILQQSDCIDRLAIRKTVGAYNKLNTLRQVSKVKTIETDATNSKCLYVFETQEYNPLTNVRNTNLLDTENEIVVVPYKYSNPTATTTNPIVQPKLALIMDTDKLELGTLRSDGSIDGDIEFNVDIRSTDFSILDPVLLSGYSNPIEITYSDGKLNPEMTSTTDLRNISRQGNRVTNSDGSKGNYSYTCDTPAIKERLITQFNLSQNNETTITEIKKTFYPSSGSKGSDGYVTCIYDVSVRFMTPNNNYDRKNQRVTMKLTPAIETTNSLYDIVYTNYPSSYIYPSIPKDGKWITIPPTLAKETKLSRTGCTSNLEMSTCANAFIMSNVVNQFNIQVTDGKIMKVRKAYTPEVDGKKVCDYEVEMLRVVDDTNTLIQKESIRIPIVESADTTQTCLWDSAFVGNNVPLPDTGISLTNNTAVPLLDVQYQWAPSFLSNITKKINDSILSYLGMNVENVISNAARSINTEALNLYETIMTSQSLYTPFHDPNDPQKNCKVNCMSTIVTQAIINQYFVDNYPYQQYGAQKREIVEVRRVGTYDSNTCQIEFIEKVVSYANFIESPIFVSDPYDSNAQFNTRYYLRQYEFTTIPDPNQCQFNIESISNIVLKNEFHLIDLNDNADAIMSDASIVPARYLANLSYAGIKVDCYNPLILQAIKDEYDSQSEIIFPPSRTIYKNVLTAISTAFNPRADVCEYTAVTSRWYKSITNTPFILNNVTVTLKAQWDSFSSRTGMDYSADSVKPTRLNEYDPATIITRMDTDGNYVSRNADGQPIENIPYTFSLPEEFDRKVISTTNHIF